MTTPKGAPAVSAACLVCVWQLSYSLNSSGARPGESVSNHREQQGRQAGSRQDGGAWPPGPHLSAWRAASSEHAPRGAPPYRCSDVSYTMRRVLFKELAREPSFCFLSFCLKEEISVLHLSHLKSKQIMHLVRSVKYPSGAFSLESICQ